MKIETTVTVLGVKELEIKKGDRKGQKFHIGHFYDGDNLIKASIPENEVKLVETYSGQVHKLYGDLNLDSKQFYYKGLE